MSKGYYIQTVHFKENGMAKTTIQDLLKKKAEGNKISMLTAYDYPFAQIIDEAGIDAVHRRFVQHLDGGRIAGSFLIRSTFCHFLLLSKSRSGDTQNVRRKT
jgi:hypothetical protein